MKGFLAALAGLPDNPVARREWRGLGHQLADWRFWCYLRRPRSMVAWAVRALLWCLPAPYLVLAILAALYRFGQPYFIQPQQYDLAGNAFVLVGLAASFIAAALMSASIGVERQKETWQSLRVAVRSPHAILVGLLAGRLGPVLVALLVSGMFWTALRPDYAPRLQPYAPVLLSQSQIAVLVWEAAGLTIAAGCLALAAAAWCRSASQGALIGAWLVCALFVTLVVALNRFPEIYGPLVVAPVAVAAAVLGYIAAYQGLLRHE